MTESNPIIPHSPYFPVLKSIRQGGLSIWLNRLSLLPLSLIPVMATFITLSIVSSFEKDALSPLVLAIIQIPADLMVGLYAALIVMIIMAAPRDRNPPNDTPMTFSIDLRQKKNIMIAAAIAHTLFGYLFLGGFTAVGYLAEPIREATQQNELRIGYILMVTAIGLAGLYAIRFNLLPVLIIGDIDIRSFYKRYRMFGLSLPVLLTKMACMFAVALIFFIPLSIIGIPTTAGGEVQLSPLQTAIYNLISAVVAVGTYAWMYASFAYGVRMMVEDRKELNQNV